MLLLTAAPALEMLELSLWDILTRMLCAMGVGALIGLEREYTHRPAGLRTHILVAVGACSVMITGQLIFAQYRPLGGTSDPARLAAQVISGVGFLGAGTIMREGVNVKGLTTAASLWAVACLGIAAGAGYYRVALIGMVLMFLTLTLMELLERLLMKGARRHNRDYEVISSDAGAAMNAINRLAEQCVCRISQIAIENLEDGVCVRFHAKFGSGARKRRQERFLEGLNASPAVRSADYSREPAQV